MNIKTRKEYSKSTYLYFEVTKCIAVDRVANFGKIKDGYHTHGVGQRILKIDSLNDYCRRPAFLFGATLRRSIKELLATSCRIKSCDVNIKNLNFTASNLIINIKTDGIQVKFKPTSKSDVKLCEAFKDVFQQALSWMHNVASFKIDEDTQYQHSTERMLKTVTFDIELTSEYLLSYAPYQEKDESEKEEPEMERRITGSQMPKGFNPFASGNKDLWKVNKTNYLGITNPPMKPIENYHADALQHSIDNIEKLIESERKGIQDVLNRIKNMEIQRDKLKAAISVLK